MAVRPPSPKRCALTLFVSLLVPTLSGCGGGSFGAQPGPGGASGKPAPALAGKTVDGEPFELTALRGQVVLVNVWATWCAPCREELPELRALHEAHAARGFTVVGVSVDRPAALRQVVQMADSFGLTYPIVFDPESRVANAWNVHGYPTSFLVDRDGNLRWRRDGLVRPNDAELTALLELALAAAAPP
ncbi:MAG: TlpA family protein disulfide reductase [Deltaproteobacteria bacterium]|nr:TlpA family protein disulfide reductase [Nannocystaceae bacterium]